MKKALVAIIAVGYLVFGAILVVLALPGAAISQDLYGQDVTDYEIEVGKPIDLFGNAGQPPDFPRTGTIFIQGRQPVMYEVESDGSVFLFGPGVEDGPVTVIVDGDRGW